MAALIPLIEAGFVDWIISMEGQSAIRSYQINGEQLFYPNANDPSA
jgi:tungstate transport system substrate-binding protein